MCASQSASSYPPLSSPNDHRLATDPLGDADTIVCRDGSRRPARHHPARGIRRAAARATGATYRRVPVRRGRDLDGAKDRVTTGSWGDGSGELIAPRGHGCGDRDAGRYAVPDNANADFLKLLRDGEKSSEKSSQEQHTESHKELHHVAR